MPLPDIFKDIDIAAICVGNTSITVLKEKDIVSIFHRPTGINGLTEKDIDSIFGEGVCRSLLSEGKIIESYNNGNYGSTIVLQF